MIKYIKRADLDIEKYDTCISDAINSRIYAFSWYLDIVADNWDVLVYNDYEAVMPLPWRSKYLIKYIYKPAWTQQLGVFSKVDISSFSIDEFLTKIPKKFLKIFINFNTESAFFVDGISKTNYLLQLDKPYDELFKKYKYERRRVIKKFDYESVEFDFSFNTKVIIDSYVSQKEGAALGKENDFLLLDQLSKTLNSKGMLDVVKVYSNDNSFLGGALFLVDKYRITYLFSIATNKGRKENIMTFIIDSIVKKYSKTNLVLDFEGSMIKGIAFFFKSFGAKPEIYKTYISKFF